MLERRSVPVRPAAVRRHAEDASPIRPRHESSGCEWFLPNLAVTFAPEPDRAPIPGEPIREPRPNIHGRTPPDLPPRRRVRRRLQLRRQELARLHVPDRRLARRRGHPHPLRGAGVRAPRRRRLRDPLRRARPRARGRADRHGDLPRTTVTADRLVLSAGTLGTTYLLLQQPRRLPRPEPDARHALLGQRRPADLRRPLHADRRAGSACRASSTPDYGPVITSAIRVRDELDGDGTGEGSTSRTRAFRSSSTGCCRESTRPGARAAWRQAWSPVWSASYLHRDRDTDVSAEISSLFGDSGLSAGVLPLLGMGRDIPDGRMSLDDGRLRSTGASMAPRRTYFDRVREVSQQVADELGATFMDNPLWYLNRVITVHALGGCPMGRDGERGRRRLEGRGLRLSRPPHRRRVGDARPGRARTPA